jgi:aminoglycoside 3-N-acetyltransferase
LILSFSWQFCKGIAFSPKETPSQTGALGNVAIRRTDFERTKHPLYSWMVWGKCQNELCNYDYVDGFDQKGVFGFLERNQAKQLLIGKQKIAGLTIGHYVEAKVGVPYRQYKCFEGDYIDREGKVSRRKYSMYVRPLNIGVVNIFGKEQVQGTMSQLGIRENFKYKDVLPLATIELEKAADFVTNDIKNNDGKQTMMVDGVCGINACGVDWSTAKYY